MKQALKTLTTAFTCILMSTTLADPHETVFTDIYTNCIWGKNEDGEGFSGGGSLLNNCKEYIHYLEQFIAKHNIKTIVDAGCGDWEFSRHVHWQDTQYLGYDVVNYVIEKNIAKYGSTTVQFKHDNFLTTDLPPADLLLCKHVLQHLTNQDILNFLPQLKKFKYCIIVNEVYPNTLSSNNEDTAIGGAHKIDLSKPPFNIVGIKALHYKVGHSTHQIFVIDHTNEQTDIHD